MHLTLQTDYALRILMFAASRAADSRRFSVEDVAHAYGISRNHVMKIVQRLAASGYLASFRGRGGGLQLGMPAEEIRLGALVRFLEDDVALVACFGDRHTCLISRHCRLQTALGSALEAFFTSLDNKTLADIALPAPALANLARNRRVSEPASLTA